MFRVLTDDSELPPAHLLAGHKPGSFPSLGVSGGDSSRKSSLSSIDRPEPRTSLTDEISDQFLMHLIVSRPPASSPLPEEEGEIIDL
jgi:hypothetical protein